VGIGADQRIGEGDRFGTIVAGEYDRREVFEIDLVHDTGTRRHHAEVLERLLRPAQQHVALTVPLVLQLDVVGEREQGAEVIDLHRVVDHQIGRHERVDARDIAAEPRHRCPHRREIDDGRDTGEILQHHATGHEGKFEIFRFARIPVREFLDVLRLDELAPGVAQHVFEQDTNCDRQALEIHALLGERGQPVVSNGGSRRGGQVGARSAGICTNRSSHEIDPLLTPHRKQPVGGNGTQPPVKSTVEVYRREQDRGVTRFRHNGKACEGNEYSFWG